MQNDNNQNDQRNQPGISTTLRENSNANGRIYDNQKRRCDGGHAAKQEEWRGKMSENTADSWGLDSEPEFDRSDVLNAMANILKEFGVDSSTILSKEQESLTEYLKKMYLYHLGSCYYPLSEIERFAIMACILKTDPVTFTVAEKSTIEILESVNCGFVCKVSDTDGITKSFIVGDYV